MLRQTKNFISRKTNGFELKKHAFFKDTKCILPININHSQFENENFSNFVRFVKNNLPNYDFLILCEKNNMFYFWHDRNKCNFDQLLQEKNNVIFLDDIIDTKQYIDAYNNIYQLYSSNVEFFDIVNSDINAHYNKNIKNYKNNMNFHDDIFKYVLRDCSIIKVLDKYKYDYLVYPASLYNAFTYINTYMKYIEINIKK